VLEERGLVVRVSPDFIVDAAVATGLEQQLKDFLADNEKITAAGFRDLIGASRKYSIPLLDYFDHSGVTIRSGDYRLLRER
jgi:selenocysteine-specific elongation factor